MVEIDKFSDLPETKQGLEIYINYAKNQIKKNERKIKQLQENIQEAHNRLNPTNKNQGA